MNKPYIICYMMTSLDGRIDCAMTENLPGVEEYYKVVNELNLDGVISGRVTAELEIAEKGKFIPTTNDNVNKEVVSKKSHNKKCYEIITDTLGTLLWKDNNEYDDDILIITSEKVNPEYLKYLDDKNISYIVTGKNKIDLKRATNILYDTFKLERLGVVGGAKINTAFLDESLLDEVIILIGAGIDGRSSFPSVFESDNPRKLTKLKLIDVKKYESGGVLLKYKTK